MIIVFCMPRFRLKEHKHWFVCNGKVNRQFLLSPSFTLTEWSWQPCLPVNTWGGLTGMSARGEKKPDDFMIHKCKHQTCSKIH